jgi:HK97 family phage portal protein
MICDRIFATQVTNTVSDFQNPTLWMEEACGVTKTNSGETVNTRTALSLSAYYACLRVISEDVGKLPLVTYRRTGPRGKDKALDHPAYDLLHVSPNPRMSALALREVVTAWALGWGNGYAEIQRDGAGRPVALWPHHPSRVATKKYGDSLLYTIRLDDGAVKVMDAENMIHIHGVGDDGVTGYSIAALAAESIGVGLAAQTFGAAFFGNGTALSGVLIHPETLSDKALKHLRESWSAQHTGPRNAYKPAILEEGMKYERMGIPPNEAQFVESRQFSVEEICRWFRVPPHKIQHLLRSTFSNIEQQNVEYVTDCLLSWLVRWEQEINRKIFLGEKDVFAEHVVNGLLRGDQTARSAFYREQFNIGALSQNDIRELENHNPIGPDGDVYYIPSTMKNCAGASDPEPEPTPPPQFQIAPPTQDEEIDPEEDPESEQEPETDEVPESTAMLVRDSVERFVRRDVAGIAKATARADERDRDEIGRALDRHYAKLRDAQVELLGGCVRAIVYPRRDVDVEAILGMALIAYYFNSRTLADSGETYEPDQEPAIQARMASLDLVKAVKDYHGNQNRS